LGVGDSGKDGHAGKVESGWLGWRMRPALKQLRQTRR
jgi:hypothetical protein